MTTDPAQPSETMLKVAAAVRSEIERAQAAGEPITDHMIATVISQAMFAGLGQGGGGLRPRQKPGSKH